MWKTLMSNNNNTSFWDKNRSPNPGQKNRPSNRWKKKSPCQIVNFAVPAHHQVKNKENVERD